MVRCPYCGYEADTSELKLVRTWNYRLWDIFYYQCPRCDSRFRYRVDVTGKCKDYAMRVKEGMPKVREAEFNVKAEGG